MGLYPSCSDHGSSGGICLDTVFFKCICAITARVLCGLMVGSIIQARSIGLTVQGAMSISSRVKPGFSRSPFQGHGKKTIARKPSSLLQRKRTAGDRTGSHSTPQTCEAVDLLSAPASQTYILNQYLPTLHGHTDKRRTQHCSPCHTSISLAKRSRSPGQERSTPSKIYTWIENKKRAIFRNIKVLMHLTSSVVLLPGRNLRRQGFSERRRSMSNGGW